MRHMTAGSRLQRLNAAVKKRSAGPQILLSEHAQALWHSYKPLTRPDRSLLDRWSAYPDSFVPFVEHCGTSRPVHLLRHASSDVADILGTVDAGKIPHRSQHVGVEHILAVGPLMRNNPLRLQVAAPPCQ